MGRPPKLDEAQRAEVKKRLIAGETVTALAIEMKVSKALISQINKQAENIKDVARQVVTAEGALRELPVTDQVIAVSLMDDLRSVMINMAAGARTGAELFVGYLGAARRITAPVLKRLGEGKAMDEKGRNSLRDAAALQKLANDAAAVPTNLLTAQKEQVKRLGETPDPGAPDMSTLTLEELQALDAIMSKVTPRQ